MCICVYEGKSYIVDVSEPEDILLYADSKTGAVGYVDAHNIGDDGAESYLIGYSKRPVGVAYDPVTKVV